MTDMRNRKLILVIAALAMLSVVGAAVAITVSASSKSTSASWLGLTQGAITNAPILDAPSSVNPDTTPRQSIVPYAIWWSLVPNATAYRIWLDGIPNSVVKADPYIAGTKEGRTISMPCGTQHRWNVQGLNAQFVGPIASLPAIWTTADCP